MESDPLFLVKKYKYIAWIVGIGLFVYANSLFGGFIWDDKTYIINNPDVRSISLNLLFGRNWYNSAGFYRPIPALYFAILYNLFGNLSFFYHVIQVAVHIVNAALVFVLFKKFFHRNLALILSLIFLVHPVNTESVSYIASSVSVVFFFFGVTALLLSWREDVSIKRKAVIFFLLLLSVMTKETGALFIFLVWGIRWIFKKKDIFQFSLFSLGTVAAYLLMRIAVIGMHYPKVTTLPIMRVPLSERLLNIPTIIFYYIKMFFFPLNLAISQNWIFSSFNLWNFSIPLGIEALLLISIGIYGMYLWNTEKKRIFGLLFFFFWLAAGLGMLLQIIPLDMTVADRWAYFPIVGMLGIVGIVGEHLYEFVRKNKKGRAIVLSAAVIIVSLLSLRTIIRNTDWIDAKTLYAHDIAVSDDYNKEDGLSLELISLGDYSQALIHAKKSVELNTNFSNLNDVGVVYQHLGNIEKAKEYYTRSVHANPETIAPYLNLASLLVLHDDPQQAIPILKNVLIKQYPSISKFWVLLAFAEYRLGNREEALSAANHAYSLGQTIQSMYVLTIVQNNTPIQDVDVQNLE